MSPHISNGSTAPPDDRTTSESFDWLKLALRRRAAKQERREYADQRAQAKWREDFELFSKAVKTLGSTFEASMRALRPIGSSSRLIHASVDLQRRLNDVFDLFRSNAAEIWMELSGGLESDELPSELRGSLGHEAPSDIRFLPCTMDDLSEALKAFLESLCDIPEFLDQRLTDSLREFRGWLRFRAGRILNHQDSLPRQDPALRRYTGQVMKEMTDHIVVISQALSAFNSDGFNVIRGSQEQAQYRLQNMSTVVSNFSISGNCNFNAVRHGQSQERRDGIMDFIAHPEHRLCYQFTVGYSLEGSYVITA
ncbi:hypothetical protein FRC01_004210 [Tulasnella sp. 417]|nr:hypothetical protein FRC01_004210 [Tulasnella sp. 417]